MRSASCSFWREKRRCSWMAAAWVPAMAAIPASPSPAAAITMPGQQRGHHWHLHTLLGFGRHGRSGAATSRGQFVGE